MRAFFRRYLQPLGKLVALEMGKIVPEGVGEVQVMIVPEGVGEVQVMIVPYGVG
jgi:hypothetical protein